MYHPNFGFFHFDSFHSSNISFAERIVKKVAPVFDGKIKNFIVIKNKGK